VRRSVAALALAGWTAFVWLTRIRNAARDGDSLWPYLVSVSFLVLAIGVLATLGRDRRWVLALVVSTLVVWPVRLVDIVFLSDDGAGFVAVHAAIGLLSIGIAVVAGREVARSRRLASAA
jgi:hypothetical protein